MRAASKLAALCAAAGLALLAPAPAQAERDLWATVNVCDTVAFPDTMGVRASMPGTKPRRRLLMRFEAQFFDSAQRAVRAHRRPLALAARGHGRLGVGAVGLRLPLRRRRRVGQLVHAPRGKVDFRWMGRRKGRWRVVKRATRLTRAGIRDVEDSDPPGYSRGRLRDQVALNRRGSLVITASTPSSSRRSISRPSSTVQT